MTTWTNRLLWLTYLALLGVLLPHTAWTFSQFEPTSWSWVGWIAATAFEGAIAAFTWRLKQHIEGSPRSRSPWRRFQTRYLNVYSASLITCIAISAAANFAHAVQFGQPFAVFADYNVPPALYSVAFGGILPLCSLLFARVLADVRPDQTEEDTAIAEERQRRREAEARTRQAEADLQQLSARLQEAEDTIRWLFATEKRQRITAAYHRWPSLPHSAIAIITDASPSYVSEIIQEERCTATTSPPTQNSDMSTTPPLAKPLLEPARDSSSPPA
jgi:hypothetical protein